MSGAPQVVHGSAVALAGRGVLVLGASGSGKSATALSLMALGAGLIADDRVCLSRAGAAVIAAAPEAISGLIEARGIGLLRADPQPPAALALVVDLDAAPPARLPPPAHRDVLGVALPLICGKGIAHLAPAVIQFLKTGLAADR
ncbi:serine kinase [Rhodobacteraceae bacterium CCMM004]|nr:serine kinase [Rhodobacteraceae bacterium CCMM004]